MLLIGTSQITNSRRVSSKIELIHHKENETETYEQLETVIFDIDRHLNNRPHVESSQEEEQILTPNAILWGQDSYALGDINEMEDDEVCRLHKRLTLARQHAWSRWQNEYIRGLMEYPWNRRDCTDSWRGKEPRSVDERKSDQAS